MLSWVACWFLRGVSVACERAGGWGCGSGAGSPLEVHPGVPWPELMRHAVVRAQPNRGSQLKTSAQASNFSPHRLQPLILSSASLLATPKWCCQITCSAPSCPPQSAWHAAAPGEQSSESARARALPLLSFVLCPGWEMMASPSLFMF